MLLLVIAAALIRIPYVAIAPGSARSTTDLIGVNGADVFPPRGEVLFTTVAIQERITLLEALRGWLDPSIRVDPEQRILGNRSPQENRQLNQVLMDDSKTVAAQVALEKLGFEVKAHGALVTEVVPDSPAAAAGALHTGDVIVGIDGQPVQFDEDLRQALAAHKPGDAVSLRVMTPSADGKSEGEPRDVGITLAARPEDPNSPLLGVGLTDYRVELPLKVTIDSGEVGGPSAGLAFTLALIDVLTPGELTGGEVVAVTGTISGDGTIGPVGGVAQKVEAAKRADAQLFLVPPDEYAEAKSHAGKGLRVVKVATLDEALRALAGVGGNGLALPQPGAQTGT